jgi:hypothetical protein
MASACRQAVVPAARGSVQRLLTSVATLPAHYFLKYPGIFPAVPLSVAHEPVGRVGLDQVQEPGAERQAEGDDTMAWLTGVDRSRPDTAP